MICGALALLATTAPPGYADGDPASDVLVFQDVYFPSSPPPAKTQMERLKRAVTTTYSRNFRIKVAIIATRNDLGSVPVLFNKPQKYARFLGIELQNVFVGPLLIVMPAGFGIYDGGRSTTAEQRVLAKLRVRGSSPDTLTESATQAAQKLTTAGALRSKDILAPRAFPITDKVQPETTAMLTYWILEDSQHSKEIVSVYEGADRLALIRVPLHRAQYKKTRSVRWEVPGGLDGTNLGYCVTPTDRTGNRGLPSCTVFTLVQ
jgi:hypothetical protein